MSKPTFGWRRAGYTATVAALVFGGTLVDAGAASAAADTFTASTVVPVAQGNLGITGGDLTYEFENSYNTNDRITFVIAGNDCTTGARILKANEFNAVPTIALADSTDAIGSTTPGTSATPAFVTSALQSSSTDCETAGITDKFTVTFGAPWDGTVTDAFKLALSDVDYNIGSDAALGNVTVNATGSHGFGSGSAVNAQVVGTAFSYTGFTAAMPNTQDVSLGTATITEHSAGTPFTTGTQGVTLTLNSAEGALLVDSAPLATVTATAGHAITNKDITGNIFSFDVTTGAGAAAATITVSGLKVDTEGKEQLTLQSNVGRPTELRALNVVDYTSHVGGNDRYATAAKMYQDTFGDGTLLNPTDVVLSSGADYADALSASYLAGQLNDGDGTGILLTTPKTLSPAAYKAIIAEKAGTVYITGGFNAVSKAIEDKLKATTVGGSPSGAKITVIRLAGINRYQTNRVINERVPNGSDTVLVASGENFPDGLGLGPIAFHEGFPLVLTKAASLSTVSSAQLDIMKPTNVVIVGGTDVVSGGAAYGISAKGITVSRLAGADRTETAGQVALWASSGLKTTDGGAIPVAGILGDGLGFGNEAAITNGASFADALAAAPYAGFRKQVILLTSSSTSLGRGTAHYLGNKGVGLLDSTEVGEVYGLGLSAAITATVLKAAAASIQK